MNKVMIGSCSSAGRNLKTKKSSAAGKTLATTCKTKKAGSKTTAKPVTKAVVKKTATKPKPVVKKVAPKPVAKKSAVMVKPKTNSNSGLKIEDLVGKKLTVEVGSGSEIGTFTKDQLIKKIREGLTHDLFNWDFYYNYTSSDTKNEYVKLYKETVLEPLMKNVNKTLNNWFDLKDASYNRFSNSEVLVIKENKDFRKLTDNWFMKTPMSDKLRNEYKYYRKSYSGVNL